MCALHNRYQRLTPGLMKVLPWLCHNFVQQDTLPQVEIVSLHQYFTYLASNNNESGCLNQSRPGACQTLKKSGKDQLRARTNFKENFDSLGLTKLIFRSASRD